MLKTSEAQLSLGTAQFGLNYGRAGRGEPVPENEIREILAKAWELGIRGIDTSPCYGTIEKRLIDLMDQHPFAITSKIPAIAPQQSKNAIEDFVKISIERMKERLGCHLHTILFHRSEDLFDQHGEVAWNAAIEAIRGTKINLGVSCYSPDEAITLCDSYSIKVVQLPGNAFDQRLISGTNLDNIELQLRSAFLQGILLLDCNEVAIRLPVATAAVRIWLDWCQIHELSPLQAALSIVKGFQDIRYCVIGVDRLSQLEEIAEAWSKVLPLQAPALAIDNLNIIDPRRWCVPA